MLNNHYNYNKWIQFNRINKINKISNRIYKINKINNRIMFKINNKVNNNKNKYNKI